MSIAYVIILSNRLALASKIVIENFDSVNHPPVLLFLNNSLVKFSNPANS